MKIKRWLFVSESTNSIPLPDTSDGINEIFIYCDQVEKSFVGDGKSHILAVVPLQFERQGSAQLANYSPQDIKRRLIK